jgi:DeoR family transcriptional regulator, copper-sensing transcriptional repressor
MQSHAEQEGWQMNSSLRRKRLYEFIRQQKSAVLQEMLPLFSVSKMTIQRDLVMLESLGLVRRIFGGAISVESLESRPVPLSASSVESCLTCLRPVTIRFVYSLSFSNGAQFYACCPSCGLMAHLRYRENVTSAMAVDFLSGRPHLAHRSFFLFGSEAAPCCSPSILTFESEESARCFQAGFGGEIDTFEQILDRLKQMKLSSSPRTGVTSRAEKQTSAS